ncbi:MATE family efflux transporter [Mucilaginibacter gilvus]|uniref:Polysaccharide biosynthesis protein n=1 Tax=Mucilaginibacter gilvus TaxID=2305909 RepID=A0A444MIY4_9SPHI|nr:hypothetical protein [Mucilaginibacter gilvus]RWY48112.1 hypothetical protein EPL05_21265 [Mucilaginibacter gilvus]
MLKKLINKVWASPTVLTWGNMVSGSIKLLVLTPLILVNYDINEIAFWYLLLTINSFAIVIDFGFYPTFSRVVSYVFNGLETLTDIDGKQKHDENKPNWPLMGRVYGTINSTYLFISFLVVVVIFSFTYYSFNRVIIKSSEPSQLWIAYYIYGFSVFVSFFARKFDSVIIGTNNIILINRWDIINNLLSTVASVLVVFFKFNLIYLASVQLLFSVILVLRDFYLERSICDGVFKKMKFFSFDKEVFLWCWNPTWRSGLLILCSTGINQVTGLIYSNVSNASMLAAYLLTLKLITTVSQFSQAPFYSKLPILTGLRIKHKIQELITLSASSMQKALLIYSLGLIVLMFLGNWGLSLIGSKAYLIDYKIIIVIGLVWFLERHHAMHAQIVVTTNKVPFYKSAIISGLINIGLVILLLPKVGIWAFPIAQGVSNLAINNWWNVKLSLDSLKTGFMSYFLKSAAIPLALLLTASFIKLILH